MPLSRVQILSTRWHNTFRCFVASTYVRRTLSCFQLSMCEDPEPNGT